MITINIERNDMPRYTSTRKCILKYSKSFLFLFFALHVNLHGNSEPKFNASDDRKIVRLFRFFKEQFRSKLGEFGFLNWHSVYRARLINIRKSKY